MSPLYVRLAELRTARVLTRDRSGSVVALFVDADDWAIRFLAVAFDDARGSMGRVRRLVSPQQLHAPGASASVLTAGARTNDLKPLGVGRIVRRLSGRSVARLTARYGLPPYWIGPGPWGSASDPLSALGGERPAPRPVTGRRRHPGPAYRDSRIIGTRVTSTTAPIGRVSDLAVDRRSWRVRYLIVRLSRHNDDAEVLVSPYWTTGPPSRRRARIDRPADLVLAAPRYRPETITLREEQTLARHYGFLVES